MTRPANTNDPAEIAKIDPTLRAEQFPRGQHTTLKRRSELQLGDIIRMAAGPVRQITSFHDEHAWAVALPGDDPGVAPNIPRVGWLMISGDYGDVVYYGNRDLASKRDQLTAIHTDLPHVDTIDRDSGLWANRDDLKVGDLMSVDYNTLIRKVVDIGDRHFWAIALPGQKVEGRPLVDRFTTDWGSVHRYKVPGPQQAAEAAPAVVEAVGPQQAATETPKVAPKYIPKVGDHFKVSPDQIISVYECVGIFDDLLVYQTPSGGTAALRTGLNTFVKVDTPLPLREVSINVFKSETRSYKPVPGVKTAAEAADSGGINRRLARVDVFPDGTVNLVRFDEDGKAIG